MLRASVILKNARQDKELELIEISKKLKVSVKYLTAIESEIKSDFPQEPYCSLIIKDYANYLGLNGEDILSLFRRDFANTTQAKPLNSQTSFFTPQFTFKVAVAFSILIFTSYLVFEYVKFNRAPMLKINWPEIDSGNHSSLEISGVTDPESTIRINQDLVIVNSAGNFQKKISLTGTEQKITIESKSQNGKTTVEEKVYRSQ